MTDTNICVIPYAIPVVDDRICKLPKQPEHRHFELEENKFVGKLKNELLYNILKTLTAYKQTGATISEVQEALKFLGDVDTDMLLSHYIHILIKKKPKKLNKTKVSYHGKH